MPAKVSSVEEYLDALELTRQSRPDQVKEALEIYVGLWKSAIAKGVIDPTDDVETALAKLEKNGGLYKAAEG
jgi:hypothetical protein